MTAETYLVLSGKGGVGKTTVFANLATSLAMMGKETIVLDADLAMANLGLVFGFVSCPVTLHEVLAGKESIENAIYEGPHGVKVVPSGETIEGFQETDPSGLVEVIDYLKQKADYLLIDTPIGINEEIILLLPLADHVIILTTPDLPSMADALRMKVIAESLNINIEGVILNRADLVNVRESKEKLEQTLELKIMAVIPDDPNTRKAAMQKIPLVVSLPNSPASLAIKHLAANIAGIEYSEEGKNSGIFQKLLGILGFNVGSNVGQD